jgi:hypothetical protein
VYFSTYAPKRGAKKIAIERRGGFFFCFFNFLFAFFKLLPPFLSLLFFLKKKLIFCIFFHFFSFFFSFCTLFFRNNQKQPYYCVKRTIKKSVSILCIKPYMFLSHLIELSSIPCFNYV